MLFIKFAVTSTYYIHNINVDTEVSLMKELKLVPSKYIIPYQSYILVRGFLLLVPDVEKRTPSRRAMTVPPWANTLILMAS